MAEKVRAHAIISGRVQGVFFRAETRDEAERHEVGGWVKNRSDGTVEALFEGNEAAVSKVLEWCKSGPPQARVKDVDIDWKDYKGEFDSFRVVY